MRFFVRIFPLILLLELALVYKAYSSQIFSGQYLPNATSDSTEKIDKTTTESNSLIYFLRYFESEELSKIGEDDNDDHQEKIDFWGEENISKLPNFDSKTIEFVPSSFEPISENNPDFYILYHCWKIDL